MPSDLFLYENRVRYRKKNVSACRVQIKTELAFIPKIWILMKGHKPLSVALVHERE